MTDPKFGPDVPEIVGPHAFVQWKGTDACLDINCSCGKLSHIDIDMPFGIKCPACGRIWKLGYFVPLIEADERLWKISESYD